MHITKASVRDIVNDITFSWWSMCVITPPLPYAMAGYTTSRSQSGLYAPSTLLTMASAIGMNVTSHEPARMRSRASRLLVETSIWV